MNRIILHSDINCFYASVEHLKHPEYNGKPLAVGGNPEKRHGIILTADYLTRKYGVRTGMTLWQAKKLCPDIIIVEPNMQLYKEYSLMAHDIYSEYTDLIEAYGIDESWLDVSKLCSDAEAGKNIATQINMRIKKELGITNSVGVSWNKIFAKLGSDYKKPDAITVFMPEHMEIIRSIPVQDLLYVGANNRKRLNDIGIFNIGHLADAPENILISRLGKMGITFKKYAMGLDDEPVMPDNYEREVKSIGNSTTTAVNLCNNEEVKRVFYELSEYVAYRMKKKAVKGKTIEITIRTKDMENISRHRRFEQYTNIADEIALKAYELFKENYHFHKSVRSLGIRMTDLVNVSEPEQLTLFTDEDNRKKHRNMDEAVDSIREKFGYDIIKRGIMYINSDKK